MSRWIGASILVLGALLGISGPAAATPPGAPGTPTGVVGNGQVALTWTLGAAGAGVVGYCIDMSTNGGTTWQRQVDCVDAPDTTETIGGLTNGTSYRFRVWGYNASNEIGADSIMSAALVPTSSGAVTVPGTPTNVGGTVGNEHVNLTWAAPSANGAPAVVKYLIAMSVDSSPYFAAVTTDNASTSFDVNDLINGRSYRFKVAAVNTNGRGAFSAESAVFEPSTPRAVWKPTVLPGDRQATVSWGPPPSFPPEGFFVGWQVIRDGTGAVVCDEPQLATRSCTVRGLDNGVPVQFRVRVVWSLGPGSGSLSDSSDPVTPNPPAGPMPSSLACAGRPATVNIGAGQQPTAGDDVIVGTPGNDVIVAGGGNDVVCGGDGNDVLKGGGGNDRLLGGGGVDKLIGGGGKKDVCVGGPAKDAAKKCEKARSL